jgi:uncharacterized protein
MTRRQPRSSKHPNATPAAAPSGVRTAPNPFALNPNPEVVDPRWLLKALAVLILLALGCGYLTLCVLFYQGQWQLVLHPSRSTPAPATIAGEPVSVVHFGLDASATPQLIGWWFAAAPTDPYAAYTVLYLPSGDGSLAASDAPATLAALHTANISVFALDYRGYGQSAVTHPTQQRMQEDADRAWAYLTTSRHLDPSRIVLFGTGVGAALATQLSARHPQSPALILRAPEPNLLDRVRGDARTRLLPVRLLFHNRFEIAHTLATLPTPKLLLVDPGPAADAVAALYRSAADPKFTLYLPSSTNPAPSFAEHLRRFFDQYLTASTIPNKGPQ